MGRCTALGLPVLDLEGVDRAGRRKGCTQVGFSLQKGGAFLFITPTPEKKRSDEPLLYSHKILIS